MHFLLFPTHPSVPQGPLTCSTTHEYVSTSPQPPKNVVPCSAHPNQACSSQPAMPPGEASLSGAWPYLEPAESPHGTIWLARRTYLPAVGKRALVGTSHGWKSRCRHVAWVAVVRGWFVIVATGSPMWSGSWEGVTGRWLYLAVQGWSVDNRYNCRWSRSHLTALVGVELSVWKSCWGDNWWRFPYAAGYRWPHGWWFPPC